MSIKEFLASSPFMKKIPQSSLDDYKSRLKAAETPKSKLQAPDTKNADLLQPIISIEDNTDKPCAVFVPNQTSIVYADKRDLILYDFELKTQKILMSFGNTIRCIAVSPIYPIIAVCIYNDTSTVIILSSDYKTIISKLQRENIDSIVFSPDGKYYATARDYGIKLYKINFVNNKFIFSTKPIKQYLRSGLNGDGDTDEITEIIFMPDSKSLLFKTYYFGLTIIDLNMKIKQHIPLDDFDIFDISSDSSEIIILDPCNGIKKFKLEPENKENEIKKLPIPDQCEVISVCDKNLLIGCINGIYKYNYDSQSSNLIIEKAMKAKSNNLVSIKTGSRTFFFCSIKYSSDHRYMLVLYYSGLIQIFLTEAERFRLRSLEFVRGTCDKQSPIHNSFSSNTLYDSNLTKLIMDYIRPE